MELMMGLEFLLTLIICNYLACMNKRRMLFSLSLMSQQINTSNLFKFSICSCQLVKFLLTSWGT